MLKAALLLAGIYALLLTSTVRDMTAHWERVLLHIEVIPIYTTPVELSYETITMQETELSISENSLDLQYHYVQPSSLPQFEYLEARTRLLTERAETVLTWLVGSLLWRQSALFVFLIYESEREPEGIGRLFARENTTYDIQSLEANITGDYLVVKLAYTQHLGLSNIHKLLRPM
jgi:hypothetical protein